MTDEVAQKLQQFDPLLAAVAAVPWLIATKARAVQRWQVLPAGWPLLPACVARWEEGVPLQRAHARRCAAREMLPSHPFHPLPPLHMSVAQEAASLQKVLLLRSKGLDEIEAWGAWEQQRQAGRGGHWHAGPPALPAARWRSTSAQRTAEHPAPSLVRPPHRLGRARRGAADLGGRARRGGAV